MKKHLFLPCSCLVVLFHLTECLAEDIPAKPATDAVITTHSESEEEKSWWHGALNWLENVRDSTSESYSSMSTSIDKYFYGKKLEDTSNKSYLKLEIQNTLYKAGDSANDIKLRAKIDLPNTKKRFKLVFDSSPDEEKSLEDRTKNDASGEKIAKDNSFAGVEYTPETKPTEWKHAFTGGIKVRIPFVPFAKYELDRQWTLPDQWKSEFEQSFWYYDDNGFGETSSINFNRPITEDYFLKIGSQVEFRDADDAYYYNLILSTTHRLSRTSSINYHTGLVGESQPVNEVTSYLLGANYRKLLYKDWLFFTIEPGISFPRDEGWHPQPSFTMAIQIYFTGDTY